MKIISPNALIWAWIFLGFLLFIGYVVLISLWMARSNWEQKPKSVRDKGKPWYVRAADRADGSRD